jgi:hypothetical protein
LPKSSDGPTAFIADPAANFAWAHSFCERYCQYPWMGPLHFQRLQPLSSRRPIVSQRIAADAPTAFSAAIAASFAWAYYFFEKYCRCPQMGPLHLQQQLPLALHEPIISLIL